ncbi:MAG: helix-turn-helix domain-containing protein [Bifidobacteriales bacterium]|nr:helix-turn-helix domain-containing protein [Bifidobacteriales bacterium]
MSTHSNTDGSKLARRRAELGLTQEQLAERAGVRYQAISNFETGWRSISSSRVSTALKLARALDCTIEDLL